MWKLFALLFIPAFLLVGCNSLYVPATPSVPVFEKKQALKVSGSIGVKGWNANADYTPLNYFYFGAAYHGMEVRGSNSHQSLGAHVGGYFNHKSFEGHSNLQFGYTLGHSYYADQFSGSSDHLRRGTGSYNKIHLQAFHSVRTVKENAWMLGIRWDAYRAHYTGLAPNFYKNEVPTRSDFLMAFICYQYSFNKLPALMTDLYLGYQVSSIEPGGHAGYAFYSGLILRVGVSYQFEFGKTKAEAQK
jgi:hypothetical protein